MKYLLIGLLFLTACSAPLRIKTVDYKPNCSQQCGERYIYNEEDNKCLCLK